MRGILFKKILKAVLDFPDNSKMWVSVPFLNLIIIPRIENMQSIHIAL